MHSNDYLAASYSELSIKNSVQEICVPGLYQIWVLWSHIWGITPHCDEAYKHFLREIGEGASENLRS